MRWTWGAWPASVCQWCSQPRELPNLGCTCFYEILCLQRKTGSETTGGDFCWKPRPDKILCPDLDKKKYRIAWNIAGTFLSQFRKQATVATREWPQQHSTKSFWRISHQGLAWQALAHPLAFCQSSLLAFGRAASRHQASQSLRLEIVGEAATASPSWDVADTGDRAADGTLHFKLVVPIFCLNELWVCVAQDLVNSAGVMENHEAKTWESLGAQTIPDLEPHDPPCPAVGARTTVVVGSLGHLRLGDIFEAPEQQVAMAAMARSTATNWVSSCTQAFLTGASSPLSSPSGYQSWEWPTQLRILAVDFVDTCRFRGYP